MIPGFSISLNNVFVPLGEIRLFSKQYD